jgi:hypothetical protein
MISGMSQKSGAGIGIYHNFTEPEDTEADIFYELHAAIALTLPLNIGGRVGYLQPIAKDLSDNPQADILTWAIFFAVEDVGPYYLIQHDLVEPSL